MKWTREKPTEPGWYWHRCPVPAAPHTEECEVVYVGYGPLRKRLVMTFLESEEWLDLTDVRDDAEWSDEPIQEPTP